MLPFRSATGCWYYLVPLTNGDFVDVLAIGERRHRCNLTFLSIRVQNEATDAEHEILFVEELITRRMANLSTEVQMVVYRTDPCTETRLSASGLVDLLVQQ